jgi:hypothetical protein
MQAMQQEQRAAKKQSKRLGDMPKTTKAPTVGEWAIEATTTTTTTTTRNIDEILAAARRGGKSKGSPSTSTGTKKPTIVATERAKRLAALATQEQQQPQPPAPPPAAATTRPIMTPPSALPPFYQSLASPVRRFVAEGEAAGAAGERATFFPLEFFDDATLETRTPEQWMRGTRRARSKWYEVDGRWSWAPCAVLEYDAALDKYLIEWDAPGADGRRQRKRVSRLNLRFDEEDTERFDRRVELAVRSRFFYEKLAMRQLRVDMKDLAGLPDLPAACVRRVLGLAGQPSSAQPVTTAATPAAAHRAARVRDLVEEVRLGYKKTNKQIEYDHRNPIEEELESFMLPMLAALRPKPPSRVGTIGVGAGGDAAFRVALEAVSIGLPSSHRRIHSALVSLWAALVDLREHRLLLAGIPMSEVEHFRAEQTRCFSGIIESVKREVQPIMIGFVMQASNEEEKDKVDKAGASRFQKLVRVANLCLKDAVKDVALASLESYAERFESYEAALAILKEPTATATTTSTTAIHAQTGSSEEASTSHVPKWVMLREVHPPLFRVNLVVEAGGKIGFNPPLAEF